MTEIRKEELQLFENQEIRSVWDAENEEWYFSIVDVVGVLTDAVDYKTARNYWKVTKHRMIAEGNELVTNCNQLKLKAADGKRRLTDVANVEQLLRIIQSIPSKKAEPFKLWLAKVGKDRLDEIADPEKAMERAVATYKVKGYSDKWISQRLRSIEIRKELTDEWQNAGINTPKEYAALTNILTQAWSGKSVKDYKELKGLKKENLRDNMTNTELALNLLAEVSATELSRMQRPSGYTIISSSNAATPELLDDSKNN